MAANIVCSCTLFLVENLSGGNWPKGPVNLIPNRKKSEILVKIAILGEMKSSIKVKNLTKNRKPGKNQNK